ncbi:hypothetical protein BC834DRAFT_874013 [Gloeopeniophorella convolvens]|nr:hypothetical protein BC834DRAFT_874013 [Gloeopeniophorella convolvens]
MCLLLEQLQWHPLAISNHDIVHAICAALNISLGRHQRLGVSQLPKPKLSLCG